MKKLIPALAFSLLTSGFLHSQNANFASKGFHLSYDSDFIDCAVKQPDGKLLLSGTFHRFNNKRVANLLRFTSQGELDTTLKVVTGTDQHIFAITAHADGSIIFSGNFTQYEKQRVQTPFIRISPGGELDASFQPQRSGINTYGISAIQVLNDGKILVAGRGIDPDYVGGLSIMRLNKDGSADRSFKLNTADQTIRGIKLAPDSSIIVHGNFRLWNHLPSSGLVRLKPTGEVDSGFAGSAITSIYGGSSSISEVLLLPDSGLLVTGNFDHYNTTPVKRLMKLRKDGSLDPSFNLDQNILLSWIDNMELLSDGGIAVSASASINGKNKWFLKLKADGSLFASNTFIGPDQYPATFGAKKIFAVGQGEFIAVGSYTGQVGGVKVGVFNRFNAAAQPYLDHLLPFSKKGLVMETAVDSAHRIIVVGKFNQYGEQPGTQSNYIARLMPDGSLDTSFNASGANAFISSVEIQKNGKIVVSGLFSELNGKPYNGIGRFNDNGSVDLQFNYGAGPDARNMYDLHVSASQQIYITGSFDRFNNVLQEGVVRLNADGSADHTFKTEGLGVHGPGSVITLPGDKVVYGESSHHTIKFFDKPMRLSKVDLQGKPDPSFQPPVVDYTVTKKVRVGEGGALYWLGTIFHDNNNPTIIDQRIIKLHPNGALDTVAFHNLPSNLLINDFEILPNNKLGIACQRLGIYDSLDVVMRLNADLSVDSSFIPVSLLYRLDHINHDGDEKIIVAGEPNRAFRLENEQVQNIAVITKNGLEVQTNRSIIKNILDTASIAKSSVGATIEQVFTITNTGNTTIELLDPATATMSGQNSTDFTIESKSKVTSLKPKESMQFSVKFSPAAVGEKYAQIKIPFSDGIQQLYAVPVIASASAVATVTSVDDLTEGGEVRVYPNPVQGTSIQIISEELLKSYELFDLSGHLIQKGALRGQGAYAIQLTKNIKGVFFLRLKTGKKDILTKMIKL